MMEDYKEVIPNKSNVKIIGRTVTIENTIWLAQSGSAIEFFFIGTNLGIITHFKQGISSLPSNYPHFAVYINNIKSLDLIADPIQQKYKIFTGEGKEPTKIKIIKLSEEKHGSIGINKLLINSLSENPIIKTEKKKMNIEFIGDSITCGYGVLGKDNEEFTTKTEDFTETYAYLISKELDFDYFVFAYSGYGIISGATTTKEKNERIIPPFYDCVGLTNGFDKYKWDSENEDNKANIILINLGTNDYTYVCQDFDKFGPEFEEGYYNFLKQVRKDNKDSYILCSYGMMGGVELSKNIIKTIDKYKKDTNDEKISFLLLKDIEEKDGYGIRKHPNIIANSKNATYIKEKIKEIFNLKYNK